MDNAEFGYVFNSHLNIRKQNGSVKAIIKLHSLYIKRQFQCQVVFPCKLDVIKKVSR